MQDTPRVLPDGFNVSDNGSGTSPDKILEETLSGLRHFRLFASACRLGIFAQCREPVTADEISSRLGLNPDLAELLLKSLVARQFLTEKDGKFSNTPFSGQYLDPASPYCLQDQITLQMHLAGLWDDLDSILRNGPRMYDPEEWFSELIIPAMAANAKCSILPKTVKAVTVLPEFRTARRLLDIGGGHGLYTIAFCQENPALDGVVFDLPGVLPATKRYIEYYQAGRVSCTPGNFFTDSLGSGFDIVFSSSNPGGRAPALIPKIHEALNPGGIYINKQGNENVLDIPVLNLEWNMWAIKGVKKDKRQYSFSHSVPLADYNRMLGEQGFIVRDVIALDEQSVMTVAQKKSC
ncbi:MULTISPECIES: methyltransferase [unclassified Methanoregula]|uniref:methyltransferase n=1 Tax=unclassified Methanoregula TaxID=2649730 RepID=UPI0009CEE23A|nr:MULTISPECIES: methyltransferase [unclassified Methanoregula]OPX64376.1 MAG: O-methyltransferase [Methanoregula sp. PtaB.Bin085]OPY34954.1 MAG: O-methyltransferase [Methanoregula sp. PtaU1.Bin006]